MSGIKFSGSGDQDVSKSPSSTNNPEKGSRSSGSSIDFTGKGGQDVGQVNSKTGLLGGKSADNGPINFTGDI